jgi:AraC-like DNA-binding protein
MKQTPIIREVTPLSNHDCLVIMDRMKDTFTYPLHTHEEFELEFIENAKGALRIVGDSIERIDQYELCLIGNENLEHRWADGGNTLKDVHEITIQFHKDLFLESLLNKKQFYSLAMMFENAKKGIVFSQPIIQKVRNRIVGLTSNKNEFGSIIEFINILHELSLDPDSYTLITNASEKNSELNENKLIHKIITYLESNLNQEIRLSEVANLVTMTEISFSRFIKKTTGKSFIVYLNDLRLSVACRLLVDSKKTVSEIIFECGFNNASHFNRLFKKRKGMTPKEFREVYVKMRLFI